MSHLNTLTSFIAGLVMFFAPCTLPIVPGYIAFIASGEKVKVLRSAVMFCFGFLITFLFFGLLAGLLGRFLLPYKFIVEKIGALCIMAFGLYVLGILNLRVFQGSTGGTFFRTLVQHKFSPVVFGVSFALGWTPCVGPVLAGIFFYAAFSWSVAKALFLFLFFSLGFIVPFLAVAYAVKHSKQEVRLVSSKWFTILAGALLLFIGLLLFTDNFSLIVAEAYKLFQFAHYQGINNFL